MPRTKQKKHWSDKLEKYHACPEGLYFCKKYRSLRSAWNNCKNPEWMVWLILEYEYGFDDYMKIYDALCEYVFGGDVNHGITLPDPYKHFGITADHIRLMFPDPPRID